MVQFIILCLCCACGFFPAQMDMSKITGYRAVEELLKAQSTHTGDSDDSLRRPGSQR